MENVKYRMLQEMLGKDFPEEYKAAVDAAIRIIPPGWVIFAVSREVTLRYGFGIKLRFTWDNDSQWEFGDIEVHGCFMQEHDGWISPEHITISRIRYNQTVAEGEYDAASGIFRSMLTEAPLSYGPETTAAR